MSIISIVGCRNKQEMRRILQETNINVSMYDLLNRKLLFKGFEHLGILTIKIDTNKNIVYEWEDIDIVDVIF